MHSITATFTDNHRHCDHLFADAEALLSRHQREQASTRFTEFQQALLHHFTLEEQQLFPQLEQQIGSSNGPTSVMRSEHEQLRRLVAELLQSLEADNEQRALGLCETLMMLLQQHNMKEERMLYPMADQLLDGTTIAPINAQLQ